MNIKIESFIYTGDLSVDDCIEQAINMVNSKDNSNDEHYGDVLTKLYYILPEHGKIIVVISDKDKIILEKDSNVLANTDINSYPFVKLPASIIEYKELIIKPSNQLDTTQILNIAQSIVDKASLEAFPYKIPTVKIINYRTGGKRETCHCWSWPGREGNTQKIKTELANNNNR